MSPAWERQPGRTLTNRGGIEVERRHARRAVVGRRNVGKKTELVLSKNIKKKGRGSQG